MQSPRLVLVLVFLLTAFALLSAACGSLKATKRSKEYEELSSIGMDYHVYCTLNKKAPSTLEEFETLGGNSPRKSLDGIRTGKYTFIWNVAPADMTEGSANTILAYEPSAQTSKGWVLFGDGRVEELSAEEFKSKPMAKPKGGK